MNKAISVFAPTLEDKEVKKPILGMYVKITARLTKYTLNCDDTI